MQLDKIKYLGVKTIDKLSELNIKTVEELLTYYPYKYDVLKPTNEVELQNKTGVIVGIIYTTAILKYIRGNLNILTFNLKTANRILKVIIYNRAFLKSKIIVDNYITLIGKYNIIDNTFIANEIRFYKLDKTIIEPKYHLSSHINNKTLTKIIKNALNVSCNLDDYIPHYLLKTYNFLDKDQAVRIMHEPTSIQALKHAKLRLIYEELFLFTLKINYLKIKRDYEISLPRNVDYEQIMQFIQTLPFALTTDQSQAVDEIINDLNSNRKMNRLLMGDVGSGKTIVAFIALYANYLNDYQAALMAPTEILAKQHYDNLINIFKNTDIKISLLLGSFNTDIKEQIRTNLIAHKIDIIVGTHAILNQNIKFHNLGLVITDEQHRFGVNQRNLLATKGVRPDILYLSATPIPRTYALALYGDMDTTIIKEKPKGRKEIKTYIKFSKELKDVLQDVLCQLKEGHQIYVVAPSIEQNSMELENVEALKDKFLMAFHNNVKIGVLHGRLKASQKEQIMLDFKNKKYNILISTTVIEVGIDIPNATIMIIFNAQRYGLATLHQLRGRVGRGDLDSYCYLIADEKTKRLEVLEKSNDGFYISQQDFNLRSEGDLFGIEQSGTMNFKIANLQRDYKILLQAKKDSQVFLNEHIKDNFRDYPLYNKILEDIDLVD